MQLGVGEDDPVCPSPVLTKGSNIRRCDAFISILRKKIVSLEYRCDKVYFFFQVILCPKSLGGETTI